MDTFAYHPPGLTLSPSGHHHLAPSGDDPATAAAFARPGSSSGAGPSTGFTQTLPPLQEHVSTESAAGNAAGASGGARPTLVGFEQLTGEDPHVGDGSSGVEGEHGGRDFSGGGEGGGAPAFSGGFRDPFPRPSLSSRDAQLQQLRNDVPLNPYAAAPHAHSFFNPHPSVNTRNTRPMTAPSGPSYFHGLSYSAAPSAFYAPALQTSANAALTHDALNLAPAPPPLAPPGSSGGLPSSQSTFQYAVDTSPNLDYDAFRARGFSMPDMAASGAGSAGDPAGGEGASPSSSGTPFFYTPPSIAPGSTFRAPHQPVPPATAPEGYYPAVLDPSQAILPHPLAASTSALLPPAPELPPPPSLQQQRPQTGPTTTRRSSTGGGGSKQYNFVQQAGQTTKRPRRRYDEIERMYNCDYPGCTKAYGTLNHLNSHKTMQKHGPKSTPAQFKEMRKAWRERKKAEAAAAARSRAVQPQPPLAPPPAAAGPPGGGGGLPNVLAMPPHMNERPRPSTSAGEYHFSLPAPFMTPLGAPMLAYPAAPAPPMAAPQGMFEAPAGPPHQAYDGELGGGYDVYGGGGGAGGSGSAMRPVTAPSYYVAPQFGAGGAGGGLATHPLAQPPATAGSYVPQRLVSGQAGAGGDRRFSLPSSSLGYGAPQQQQQQQQQQQPATTLEMPRPVHAGPNGYSALIHGGVTAAQTASSNGVGSGADGRPGSGSLGLGAGAGGAAKLALGGAGGGDEGGSFEEIAAQ